MDLPLIMILALVLGVLAAAPATFGADSRDLFEDPRVSPSAGRPQLIFARPLHRREPAGGTVRPLTRK